MQEEHVLGLGLALGVGVALVNVLSYRTPPDPCAGIVCATGLHCVGGSCVPIGCTTGNCPPPGVCFEDPAIGVICQCNPPNQLVAGVCTSPAGCSSTNCPSPAVCIGDACTCVAPNTIIAGVCTPPPTCNATTCPAPGACVGNTCTCPSPYVLVGGVCTDPCASMICPPNAVCAGGVCQCLPPNTWNGGHTQCNPPSTCNSTNCPPPNFCVGNTCTAPSGGGGEIPINILVKDPGLAAFWNQHAHPGDYAHAGGVSLSQLTSFVGHHKQLTTSSVSMAASIATVKANGLTEISFNYEFPTSGVGSITMAQLLADTANAHNQCKAAGIPMTIGWTGYWVRQIIANGAIGQIAGLGEGFMYQLESIQGNAGWMAEVAHEVALIRAVQHWPAGLQVQVSCNPPGGGNNKQLLPFNTIIADIDGLLQVMQPDVLQIFAIEILAPNVAMLEQVLAHYRP